MFASGAELGVKGFVAKLNISPSCLEKPVASFASSWNFGSFASPVAGENIVAVEPALKGILNLLDPSLVPYFGLDASPPSLNFWVFRASNVPTPYFLTESALITYSPFESMAGIESDVAVPGPDICPPVAALVESPCAFRCSIM